MAEWRVAVVDDHGLVRDAIARVLAEDPELPGIEAVQEHSLERLKSRIAGGLEVDLVIVDAELPELAGLLGLSEFRSTFPMIPVLVMSESFDTRLMERCAIVGVAGMISKSGTARQIRRGVRAVLAGQGWGPEELACERAIGASDRFA